MSRNETPTDRTRIALATSAEWPALAPDDRLLADALEARGASAIAAVWSDPGIAWRDHDAVVIRSCWDYHRRHVEFLDWLARLESSGVRVLNTPTTVRWNADKSYLRDLATRGHRVVPTAWVARGATRGLAELLVECGWSEAVVKPAVSASGHDTWRTSRDAARDHEAAFRTLVARGDVLVQRFVPEIVADGEWSLVFIDGAFSHAVLKRAAPAEFRVQREYGGLHVVASPLPAVRGDAESLVDGLAETPLYARVDGCVVDGRLMLMELELIEPALYLEESPGAAARLAEAVLARCR